MLDCKNNLIQVGEKKFPCGTSLAMAYVGGKWKTVILYHLKGGKKRYNELRKNMPTVTERTLSLQLKQLEKDNMLKRKVYTRKPPLRVEYELTDFGQSFIPILDLITSWGNSIAKTKGTIISI